MSLTRIFTLCLLFSGIYLDAAEQSFPDFQSKLDTLISEGVPGAILLIETPQQRFLGSAGHADLRDGMSMPVDAVMPNGSAGKKLTALFAAILHAEGKLNLDEPITQYLLPELLGQIQFSSQMTLRQLLNHTSGIFEYNDSDNYAFFRAQFSSPELIKGDEFPLGFALGRNGYFRPGKEFSYSNTGYALAGVIFKRVLGEHPAAQIRQKIFEPLTMRHSYIKAVEPHEPDFISGYFINDAEPDFPLPYNKYIDMKPHMASIATMDAPLVSSVTDMARLLKAIVKGHSAISSCAQDQLVGEANFVSANGPRFYSTSDFYYGLGLFVEDIQGKRIFHHGGTEFGYFTQNIYVPDGDISTTVFANCGVNDHCEEVFQAFTFEVLDHFLNIAK